MEVVCVLFEPVVSKQQDSDTEDWFGRLYKSAYCLLVH